MRLLWGAPLPAPWRGIPALASFAPPAFILRPVLWASHMPTTVLLGLLHPSVLCDGQVRARGEERWALPAVSPCPVLPCGDKAIPVGVWGVPVGKLVSCTGTYGQGQGGCF